MNKSKFLKLFAMIELLTALIFITLAVIFYISKDSIGGDTMIPVIFASIGVCALIAVPVLFTIAKRQNSENSSIQQ